MTGCDQTKDIKGALECAGEEKRVVGGRGRILWAVSTQSGVETVTGGALASGAIWENGEKDHYRHREWKPVECVGRREHVYKA